MSFADEHFTICGTSLVYCHCNFHSVALAEHVVMVVFVDLISPQFNLAGNYLRDNGVSTLVTSF